MLKKKARLTFFNKSKYDFQKLVADPNDIATNLRNYINGFSKNARGILEHFNFEDHIERLALKINQQKQSKLTDVYLENLLGEDVYRDKIIALRKEEDELKKLPAGYELREIERERSEGYINRVKDFLDEYDDSKEKIDFATKKQLAGLLFKNIKIASCLGGRLPQKRISFSLFAPFNFLFSETVKKSQCQKNQKLIKICPKKSTSVPSAGRWLRYRGTWRK